MSSLARWGRAALLSLASLCFVGLITAASMDSPIDGVYQAAPHLAVAQIVYQNGASPAASYRGASDTFISRVGDEVANYGREPVLSLRSLDLRAIMLRFDLPGLSSGDTINQATLSLYVSSQPTGADPVLANLYRVLRPWSEMEATWYNAAGGDLWSLPGCNSPGADRSSVPSASKVISGAGVWLDLDVTNLVRTWVANPDANFGVVIKATSAPHGPGLDDHDDEFYLLSANYTPDIALRPKLTVVYTPADEEAPTPTPTIAYGPPTTVVFQEMLSPSAEYTGTICTFISDYGDPDRNYGLDAVLRLRSNDHRASLIQFDVSSIPDLARIYSATLELYSQSRTNLNPLPVSAHRLLRPWVETEATWNVAAQGQRWAFPGANGLTTDRAPDAFGAAILSTIGEWTAWDVTAQAQDWVSRPEANYGVIFKAGSGTQVEYSLIASHYLANPSLRPKLTIIYALPENVTPLPRATSTRTATPSRTPTPVVAPTVITFQWGQKPYSGYTQVSDTYISREGDLTANYGREPALTVGANDTRSALLRFDLTMIPPWATVRYARLALFSDEASNGYPVTINAFRVLRPWAETEATWLNAFNNVQWTAAGVNGIDEDRTGVAADTRVVATLGDWYELDVTEMASVWVAVPDENYGLILKAADGPQVSYDFRSSQYQGVQGAVFRPRLTIGYTLPEGPTPTPSRTRTPSPTATRAFTYLPVILSRYEPPFIPTATGTPTVYVSPTETLTPTPTWTPEPTFTPTPIPSPTATATPMPVTIVFRQGTSPFPSYNGVTDTYISDYAAGDATTNFAADASLAVRSQNRRVALLRFDVTSIPVMATILAASLSLSVDSQSQELPLTVGMHEVLRPWVGYQATWLQAAAGAPWGSPGASSASDRHVQPVASATFGEVDVWYEFDVRTLVQVWVASPAANRGVLLAAPGGGDVEYRLRSSDHANPSLRPKLVVTYVP